MLLAEEIVAPGGPSAPAWAFFTAMTLALLGIIGQQLSARSQLRQLKADSEATRNDASKASASATAAQANTNNVSNGFVARMDTKLDRIQDTQQATNEDIRKVSTALNRHLEWHLSERSKDNA